MTQVESNAREPDHSICQGEERQAEYWNPSCLGHFRVYAFNGDMRRYHCCDSLTVARRSRFSSGARRATHLFRKRSPVSGRPCTTLLGWYRNQWDALLGVLGVKANCGLFGHGFRVVPELSTTTMASTATTLPLSLSSICCVHLPVFPFFIAGFVLLA